MKKNKLFVFSILFFALLLAVFAFGLSRIKTAIVVRQPVNFPVARAVNAKLTIEEVTLGQKLFDDPLLSRSGKIACASCHQQKYAYSSAGVAVNNGVDPAVLGTRNTPALMNLQWKHSYFRDGRENVLQHTAVNAITSPAEMGETMANVVYKLNNSPLYRNHFLTVYKTEKINESHLKEAIEQYLLSLVSANSRYDQVTAQQRGQFTTAEASGAALFQQKCASCHSTSLFTDESLRNIGTSGKGEAVKKFKVPSLRNVAVTAPYFHDGRFNTLEEVMQYYVSGIRKAPGLDPVLLHGGTPGIPLSIQEQQQLISFLKTLTDDAFIHKATLQ